MVKIAEYMAASDGAVEGLAAAVARLANEPELRERLARLGLERAWELTWERSGAELLSAYAACVGVAGVGGRGGVVVSRRAGSSVRPA
jgi:glycosyltransferase involved in cell wall biosynthesis